MTIFELVLWICIAYVIISSSRVFISKITSNTQQQEIVEGEEELLPSRVQRRTIHADIRLECINDHWYGWLQAQGHERFIAQGATKQEVITNCSRTMVRDDKIYVIKYIEK